MMLEDIARTYGMTDYYDNIGGNIYELPQTMEAPDNEQELLVPVKDAMGDNILVGYARIMPGYGRWGKVDGIDFSHMPRIYWSNKTKISCLQRRVIVYSIMYYEMSENCISDKQFDAIAYQLVDLQKKDPESHKRSQYYYAMYDFDGSTGFDIPSRLTKRDREYLAQIAECVQRNRV